MSGALACIPLLSIALLVSAGCAGARETDEVAYVLSVGVDAAPENKLEITYRVAIPRALAGENTGSANISKTATLLTVTASSLAEGRTLLNSAIARVPNLSHVTAFIVGEPLARAGLGGVTGQLLRYREFRGTMHMMVAQGTAKDFLLHNTPEETLSSRWVEIFFLSAPESGYFPNTTLHEFYTRLKSGSGSPYLALIGINPLTGQGEPDRPLIPDRKTADYLPQSIPRQEGNPATVVGTAVFKEDKLAGMLGGEETRALNLLLSKTGYFFMVVEDPLSPGHSINAQMRLGRKPDISVTLNGTQPVIHVNVLLEGEATNIASGIYYESQEYRELLEQQLSLVMRRQIIATLERTQEWDTDVVDFGCYLRPHFATDQEFRNLHWDTLYRQADLDIQVTSRLRRSGLMRKTLPIRRQGD